MRSYSDVIRHVCFYSHSHRDLVGHSNKAFNANARIALLPQADTDSKSFE